MARVLLVDDDRDIREIGRALLTSSGHDVFTADSVVTALQFISQNPLDLLITDANMPLHSGFDLVRTLKKDPRYANLTIAMLTGRRERRDIEKALELGVHDYIVKPIDPQLFLQKVSDLLERRPPQERAEADFTSLNMRVAAQVSTNAEITSLSEFGCTLHSAHRYTDGTRIHLECDLFAKIGIQQPLLRVLSSQERDGGWDTRIAFAGADEKTLSRIRAWIHSNMTKKPRATG